MYGTWVHARLEATIHNKDQKNTKPWEAENPFIRTWNPCVKKNQLKYLVHGT
jgi:hypothetical protein